MKTREPVLLTMSILAGAQILFGGVAGVSYFEGNEAVAAVCALGMIVVGAIQFGVQFYVRGQVMPIEDVVEFSDRAGHVISGPANEVIPHGWPVRDLGELEPLG